MLSFPPTSPEILSNCFHCFSLAGVAISLSSTFLSSVAALPSDTVQKPLTLLLLAGLSFTALNSKSASQ